jgi:hypothetical protein
VVEPITLYQAKLQCGFGPMQDTDRAAEEILGAQLRPFIVAARAIAENYMDRAIFNQTWIRTLDHFPIWWSMNSTVNPSYRKDWPYYSDYLNAVTIDVPRPKTNSVVSITYVDQNNNVQTVDPCQYQVDLTSEPARITPVDGITWPSGMTYKPGSVVITYVAGSYGDGVLVDTCPQDLKAAIKLLLARLYQLGSPEPLDLKLISPAAGALLDFYSNYNFSYRPA